MGFVHLRTADIWGPSLFAAGAAPAHCRKLSGIPGPHPLHVSSNATLCPQLWQPGYLQTLTTVPGEEGRGGKISPDWEPPLQGWKISPPLSRRPAATLRMPTCGLVLLFSCLQNCPLFVPCSVFSLPAKSDIIQHSTKKPWPIPWPSWPPVFLPSSHHTCSQNVSRRPHKDSCLSWRKMFSV